MPYVICYYHIVWATKGRQPLIDSVVMKTIKETILEKSSDHRCQVYAIGGISDHIHIAVSIPPALAVAVWVSKVKGLSAYSVNQDFPDRDEIFRWQSGYSVHTFGEKALRTVVAYIENQEAHHRQNLLQPEFERLDYK
jgi:REP element-mobilizing transposase RayT